jgi:hypothetical protein
MLDQLILAQLLAGMLQQKKQQVKGASCEHDGLAGAAQNARAGIDLKVIKKV